MAEVTRLIDAAAAGDAKAASELLPLVYDELRKLAAARMAEERPGQTLQATALVHEAYVRLVGPMDAPKWHGRGHFFAAAAEAMRRILVETARRKHAEKRGGDRARADVALLAGPELSADLLEIDDLLDCFVRVNPQAAEMVKLRFFAGLTGDQAAT